MQEPSIDFLNDLQNVPVYLDRDLILKNLKNIDNWPLFYDWGQPSCEVILPDGNKLHKELYDNNSKLNFEKVSNFYLQGFTLLLSNVGINFDEIKTFQKLLNHYFNKFININLYAGNGQHSISFKNHKHDYGVIVRNVQGKSIWVFNNSQEILLDSNNVIFFEPAVPHYVKKILEDKITLTCNIK